MRTVNGPAITFGLVLLLLGLAAPRPAIAAVRYHTMKQELVRNYLSKCKAGEDTFIDCEIYFTGVHNTLVTAGIVECSTKGFDHVKMFAELQTDRAVWDTPMPSAIYQALHRFCQRAKKVDVMASPDKADDTMPFQAYLEQSNKQSREEAEAAREQIEAARQRLSISPQAPKKQGQPAR